MPKWTLPVAISIGAALTWLGLERSNVDEPNQPQPEKTISTEPLEVSAPAPEQQIPLERTDKAAAKESRAGSLVEEPATENMPNSAPDPGAASDEIRDREWDARRDRSLDQLTALSPP